MDGMSFHRPHKVEVERSEAMFKLSKLAQEANLFFSSYGLWDSALSQPLIPQDIATQDRAVHQSGATNVSGGDSSAVAEGMKDALKTNFDEMKFQALMDAQINHKEELLSIITTSVKDVNKQIQSHTQQKEETLDKQCVFLRYYFDANLNWRLARHHTELLNDVRDFMTPVVHTVHNLHDKLGKLTQNMDSVSQEMVTMRHILNMSAQNCPCLGSRSSSHRAVEGGPEVSPLVDRNF